MKKDMAKYRKRPVIIDAIEWTGKNEKQVLDFMNWQHADVENGELHIHTLEGRMHASIGDFVIRGVAGEFYACKPEIFHATYELVE